MAYPFDESFDSGIPAGFGSAGGAGGVTAIWNAAAQAVDLVFTANQSFWKITSAPQASDFWFEMDLEILAATANPYFGFWLWSGVGNYEGHRLAVINGHWYHSFWNPSGSEAEQIAATSAAWAVPGARAVLRLDVRRSAAGLWQYRLTVNETVVWQESKRWYSTLIPGVFGNATTLRLHRAAGNTPSALPDAPAIGVRALQLTPARRILVPEHAAALTFNHRGLRRLALRARLVRVRLAWPGLVRLVALRAWLLLLRAARCAPGAARRCRRAAGFAPRAARPAGRPRSASAPDAGARPSRARNSARAAGRSWAEA